MAEDLLDRIRREVHERTEAARAAYDESRRLEAALEALAGASRVAAAAAPPEPAAPVPPRTPPGENRRRILEVVRDRAGVSAGEVSQVTGIARATVASTLAKLAGEGLLERVERPAGGVGFKTAPEPSAFAGPAPSAAAPADAEPAPAAEGDTEAGAGTAEPEPEPDDPPAEAGAGTAEPEPEPEPEPDDPPAEAGPDTP